jgi:2-phosphosulfolactate phosphatase
MTTNSELRTQNSELRTIEVCFSPELYPHILNKRNNIVVIIDILRASTSICTAIQNGVKKIIPVAGIEEAKEYKKKGFIVAAERNGIKLDFADFGNSPFNFTVEAVKGREIVYSTTNGTQAINMIKDCDDVIIACFNNLSAVANWLSEKDKNVLMLCAGWKQKFSLEDSVFAGAMVEELLKHPDYKINCDSAAASLDLWNIAKKDLIAYMDKALHRLRLKKYGLDDVLEYTFTLNSLSVVPKLVDGALINVA